MHSLVRLAALAGTSLVLSRIARGQLGDHDSIERTAASTKSSSATPAAPARSEPPCPAATLPDHGACVPVPRGMEDGEGAPATEVEQNAHHDRRGRWISYEHLPKRADRSPEYRQYQFPITVQKTQSFVMSGYDLERPDESQRRGSMKAVGHGGVDLAAPRGTPIHAVALEHQVADAEVLFVGELFGTSVVLMHTVREAGVDREYLALHGHLERPAPGLKRGDVVPAGTLIGFVGDSGSRGIVHLHYEIRRARDRVRLRELGPGELAHNTKTLACDPRNVLQPASP